MTLAIAITTLLCSLLVVIPVSMLRGADEVVQETPASLPIEETKPEEASDKAPQPIMNDLASGHKYEPAAILPPIPRTAPTNNRDSTRPLLERLSDDPEQRAMELEYLTSRRFGDDRDELRHDFLEDPADETNLRKPFADCQREWDAWWLRRNSKWLTM